MATYYIRTTGSDSNNGLSAANAWLTFGKALGTTGMSSGDTVYVGAGVYREVISVTMASPTVETKIIGDVDGVHTGDAGEVQWSAYLTNDTTAPSASPIVTLNSRDFLTFENILFVPGNSNAIHGTTATPTDIVVRKCGFLAGGTATNTFITFGTAANAASNWVIDSCTFMRGSGVCVSIVLTRTTGADFDYNILIKNCLFMGGGSSACISVSSTGGNTFNGGGIDIYNCTQLCRGSFITTVAPTISTTIPSTVYNCYLFGGSPSVSFDIDTLGQVIEDYNIILNSAPRTNCAIGANSISDGSHAPAFYMGYEYIGVGSNLRPMGMPKLGSSMARFGNQASSPSTDILGTARPTGSVLPSIGCYEAGNTAVKETTTVRTGSNAIKITGAGYQDFHINVDTVSTTITIYTQFNGSYAGTKPSMSIINGTEAGVANATATAVGSANTWEQLSLSFTPTSAGIITIRLISSSTATAGAAYFDDFDIT